MAHRRKTKKHYSISPKLVKCRVVEWGTKDREDGNINQGYHWKTIYPSINVARRAIRKNPQFSASILDPIYKTSCRTIKSPGLSSSGKKK